MGVDSKTPSTLLDVGKLPHRSVRKYSSAMEATHSPQKGRSVKSAFGILQTHPCAPGLSSIIFPDWTVPVCLSASCLRLREARRQAHVWFTVIISEPGTGHRATWSSVWGAGGGRWLEGGERE